MSDIVFTITKRAGKGASGVLTWAAKNLSAPATSGPFGKGALPLGTYTAERAKLLDRDGMPSYCDNGGHCWMQPMDMPGSGRTDLGIHPDGNTPGTEGCIGINPSVDTDPWYKAFRSVKGSVSVLVEESRGVVAEGEQEAGEANAAGRIVQAMLQEVRTVVTSDASNRVLFPDGIELIDCAVTLNSNEGFTVKLKIAGKGALAGP